MSLYLFGPNTGGLEFLQTSIPVVLALALVLMVADAIIDARSNKQP